MLSVALMIIPDELGICDANLSSLIATVGGKDCGADGQGCIYCINLYE